MIALIIIVVIAAVIGFMVMGGYNRLVALNQSADQAFADIDVQLKQRNDLIPNLVETVKGYASHEAGTLAAVTQARAAAAGATTVDQKVQADNMLTGALGKLFAVAEAYPQLQASCRISRTSWPPPAASSTTRLPSSTRCGPSSRRCCSPGCSASAPTSPSSTWTLRTAPP